MGYVYLIIASLMWSFVGIMVKAASGMVSSSVITLFRFLFGAVFLAFFMLAKQKKPRVIWKDRWIWIGVFGKSCNYIFENIAITMGFASGNVVVWPVQAIFLAVVSVMLFGERINFRKALAVVFCILGVILISLRGEPFQGITGENLIPLVLFVLAAIGAGIHVMSQKQLLRKMDSLSMNYSVFILASLITAVPVPFSFKVSTHPNLVAIVSLIGLGIVTGVSFYLYAEALKRIQLLVAVTISNSSVMFTLLWAWIFFKEEINLSMIAGAVIMLAGLILINIPNKRIKKEDKL